MTSIQRTIPKWAKLSPYLKEKADGYIIFQLSGLSYCIPLTSDMKKLFNISRSKTKYFFKNEGTRLLFEKMLRDIASSLYLQVRDTVGKEIESGLMREVTSRIEEIMAPKISGEIERRFNDETRLLTGESTRAED